ncbi:hypothetical protein OL599_13060 [Rhodovastum sp. RN2-1]|uniref:Phosphoesterase n=1 Tax=Limobrevibacterium gyesilva TaxID=2991712 RepID=A0AA41YNA5_9PROT|nr:hypothetical protein [Limobrevibacterium gyesilva]
MYITGAPGTVTNGGTINGQAYGVALGAGGTVTNTSSIIGGHNGVRIVGAIGTLINSGSIVATAGDVIAFHSGGSVSNAAGASITGQGTQGAGIYISGGASTVTNSGTISGIDYAVDLAAGGNVVNNAGATITSHRGVNILGGTGTVNNSGSIAGTTSFGVRLQAGGQVTNAAGGSISGPLGVAIYAAAGTVTNSGTITGTSHAVTFAGTGSNRLVVGATGVFIGDVVGSTIAGSSNTLELAGGTGSLSGLSAGAGSVTENAHTWAFRNFAALAVDAGGAWTLNGTNTIATIADSGSLTIASAGRLTVTTAVDPASTGLFSLAGNAVLDFAADVGSGVQVAFQGPTGVLELADIVGGVVRQFGGTIAGLNAGASITIPTNAINIQTTVTGAVLSGNTITVSNNATTVATLVLSAAPVAGSTVVTRADATLGGFDVFLTNTGNTLPTVTWSPGTETGVEGGAIALGTIAPTGTGLTSVLVTGIPAGATLSDPTHSFIASAGTTSVNVLGWTYAGLTIKPVNDANFSLSVQATDAAANVSAAASEAVTVNPLAPTVAPVTVSGIVGQAIALNLGLSANGLAGDSNSLASVTLGGIPAGATLSNTNGNVLTVTGGSIAFTASQLAAGVMNGLAITPASSGSFLLSVSATEQDAQGDPSTATNGTEALSVGGLPTVTWSPGTETGVEANAIALGTIAPTGTGLTSVLVTGIPVGATLGDGAHSFVATAGTTSVNVLGWSYTGLTIKPVNDANFTLSVQATDAAANVSAAAGEAVTVNPLAPTVAPVTVSGIVGQAIALNLGLAANGLAGDSNSLASVTLGGIPAGATLSNTNGNVLTVTGGSIAFTASQLAAGVLNGLAITPASSGSFLLSVSATEQDAQGDPSTATTATETLSVGGLPTVTWSPGTETGVEANAIALGTIAPTGTGLTSVLVTGIPVGATLGDGTHSFVATAGTTSVNVLGWNYAGLTITPVSDANFSLSVQATDAAANVSAAASEAVTVNPLRPTVAPPSSSGIVGQAIPLSLGITANGLAGDSNRLASVTLGGIPAGATLSNANNDVLAITGGSIAFTTSQLAAGVLNGLAITSTSAGSFSLSVTATEQDAQGNLSGTATGTDSLTVSTSPNPSVPAYSHIVVVMMENHNYDQIIGNAQAPYINALANGGALLTNYDALVHPSQPNYFALYAGDTFGVVDDNPHTESGPTIATILQGAGKTFIGYVEHPNTSFDHNPWESFPEGFSVESDFSTFPTGNYAALPTVAFVSPNTNDDMHNGTIQQGDTWLQANINGYAQWAKANNSLLILTWDENDDASGGVGEPSNQVATIFYGANVVTGTNNTAYNHYNTLSTILASSGLAAPANAAGAATINVFASNPTVTWSPVTQTGLEGNAILLGTITPSGTGLTSVLVSGIPVGATLSDGAHSFTATAGTTSVNVLGWTYAGLSIKPVGDANFSLSAQATDGAANVSAAASEAVTVTPLAPTVAPLAASGTVGQAIVLNLGITANSLAGDSNSLSSVTLGGIPAGATLSNTNNNVLTITGASITFSASQLAAGVLNGLAITPASGGSFTLSVAATEQDAQGDTSTTTSGTEALSVGVGGTISTSIAGPFVLSAASNPLTITSTGKVTSTGTADGIDGAPLTTWTITNSGTISAATGFGISLAGAGIVSSGGVITGKDGIVVLGGGSVTNTGSIGAVGPIGSGPSVGAGVFITGAPGTITNSGTINGQAYGVALNAGGTVTNTGSIIGGEDGVQAVSAAGTLINSGSVIATADDGVGFHAGGSVTNAAGGSISCQGTQGAGVYISGGACTVTNSGAISGIDYAVDLAAGGNAVNNAGATITSQRGVNILGGIGTVSNSGSIAGTTTFGVRLQAGGQVTNAVGGSISGPLGVAVYAAAGTVTNSGTITGTSHAVTFAGTGSNRLVVGATGVFIGDVVGSTIAGSSNTLELAGGTGSLSGLSAGAGSVTENAPSWAFTNFTALAVDAGGAWTLNGTNTIATIADSGSLTIASAGRLTVTTAVDPASTGLFSLAGNAVLDFAADVGSGVQVAFQGPTGVLELADIVGGVVRQFGGTIAGLNAGASITIPTNAINVQTTVTGAVLSGNTITVSNNATTVATLVLSAAPVTGSTVVTRADATLGGFDVFLTSATAPTVTWSPATETGVEGGAIALGTIAPTGNGLTSVLVSGVPVGATLGDGTHSFVASAGATSVNVLGWNYAGLTITPANDANFTLSVQATDAAANVSAVASEAVTVNPLAPAVAPLAVSGIVGQAIALNLGLAANGLAGDSNSLASVTLGAIPAGAILSNTNNNVLIITGGSITFSASQLQAGVLNGLAITSTSAGSFSLSVSATEQDAQGNLSAATNGTEALSVGGLPTVAWSPGTETGVEGGAIALGTITPTGTGLTSVLVSGIPVGATLGDGTHSFVASAGTTSVNVLGWNYAGLTIRPVSDANFSLSVQATDAAANVSAAASEAVTVNPLAPTVAPVTVSGIVGQAIALNLGITANGLAGDSNSLASVTLGGIPTGATLSNTNGNVLTVTGGSIAFTASQLAAGVLNGLAITPASSGSFLLSVSATEQDAQGDPSAAANGTEALSVGGLPTVAWSPGTETGVEGGAIALGTITPTGTGLTSVLVSGIPVGATLGDGTHSFVASAGTTSVNVLGWTYAGLTIKPVNDTNFSLSVQATDASANVSATANEAVTVNPLAPTVAPAPVSGIVGQAIALNLGLAANGLAGDSNSLASVTLGGIPAGATLSNTNGNVLTITGGGIAFSASQLAAGVLNGLAITPASAGNLSLSVAATEQDAQGDPSTTTTATEALSVGGLPTVAWSPGTETGVEGSTLALGTITPTGTGLTSVLVGGIPVGATLSDATHSFVATAGTTSVNVLGWNYAGLSIKPVNDANFSLSVQATDAAADVSAAASEAVTVNPLAPTVAPVAVSGTISHAIALNLGITTNSLAGDSNSLASVTIGGIPAGATLTNTNNNVLTITGGSITFSASQLAAGVLTGLAITPASAGTFTLSVAAAEQDAQANLSTTTSGSETLTVSGTVGAGGTISTSVTGPVTLTAATNPLTITSTGKVTTTGSGNGINGASGTSWTVNNSGTVSASTGSASGIRLSGPGFVTNSGMITTGGTGYGVGLDGGGTVTNTSTIIGGEDGVRITTGIGTLINSGSIASKIDDGIGFFAGGSVMNAVGGSISNQGTKGAGIYITGGGGTVTNSGAIAGIDYAIDIAKGGTVTNNAGATITSHRGVNILGGTGTVSNSGSIAGTTSFGVRLQAGGQVANAAGGSISGPLGVAVYSAVGTVTNSGTITGTSHAVTFAGSGSNRLVVGATGVFIGDIVGSTASGSTNTLELAGGTGTLSGLTTAGAGNVTENAHTWAFRNFTTVAVDAGGTWTMTGTDSVATMLNNGTVSVASGGRLNVTSAVDPASSGLFLLAGSSTLEVAAALGTNGLMDFVGSSRLVIDKFASFGTNVGSTSYAGPQLLDFGAGDTIDLLGFSATSNVLNYSPATGVLQISNGAAQLASLDFQNTSLGTGAFHTVSDGTTGIFLTRV